MVYPTSDLSSENVLRDIHDAATQSIRTNVSAVIAPGLEVIISQADDSIKIGDGTNLITSTNINGKQGLDVTVTNPGALVTVPFDSIYPSYPNATTEIYVYKQSASTVATVTVTYIDSTKNNLISIVRT